MPKRRSDFNEARHTVISALLQAGGPMGLPELAEQCGVADEDALAVLKELADQDQVVQGKLLPDKPGTQYCWWACWERAEERRIADLREEIRTLIPPDGNAAEQGVDIDGEPASAFHDYVINTYKPPADKRILVFFQCSVRRPFSSSPSHASMRRAISTATGYDPANDFIRCPVHVVVLASKIGPAPYELEDVYPVNVGSGGVKHFKDDHYERMKPMLAERMAQYVTAHRDCYDHIATFTEGRYGEVMAEAGKTAGIDFPIFPVRDGPRIVRMGKSRPRPYWEKYWIQLYLEIVNWLEPSRQAQAQKRLKEMDVVYEGRSGGER